VLMISHTCRIYNGNGSMCSFGGEEGGGRTLVDGCLGFEPRMAQLCRLEAFVLWGEVTLPEVLYSW
jgi:hypothetical protein